MNASITLLHRVLPSSVGLKASIAEDHPSAQILGTERMGSGTIIDSGGLILTVNYVVLGAQSVEVTLIDGTTMSGEVVARDFHSGLAAVKIPPPATIGVRPVFELALGQEIFIVASVGGADRRVSSGGVTGLESFDAFWEFHLDRAILTTAMNPGLGGGGMFDGGGALAGIVSLDFNEVGRFTMAVPVDNFFGHRDELLHHGRRVSRPPRAWIGLYCHVLREHVIIAGVLPGAPAERSGLQAGDVVISLNGARVVDRGSLYQQLWEHKPGEVVTFRVFRRNAVEEVTVEAADPEAFFA
jgi:S1-C subfamily serine protease